MRPSADDYFMSIAILVGTRATCIRRSVGCVLVNERKHILSTGYNGRAAGLPHCNHAEQAFMGGRPATISNMYTDHPYACEGAEAPSGQSLDLCEAIHAEQNALLQCRDVWEIDTCYVTHSPCITCVKLLMNTSCKRVVFVKPYAHDDAAKKLWGSDREWICIDMPIPF